VSTATLAGPRWSSAVLCPRRAVYEGLGYPREPDPPELAGVFRRGRFIGAAVAADLDESLREQGRPVGQAEREIPWPPETPVGTGHADYFIPDEARIVEAVSTKGCDLPPHKAVQGAGYALADPEAEAATVLSIDPNDYSERAYPLDLDGLRDEVEAIWDTVLGHLRAKAIPPRPEHLEHPGQRPCFDCPFRRTCWAGFEPLPAPRLPERLHDDLRRLADLEDEIARAKQVDHLTSERDEIRERLAGLLEDGVDYIGGGIRVKRTPVKGRRSFGLSAFEKAGHRLPPEAQEFVTESGGYDRWTVRREER
jgi:hypothetical protein